MGRFKKKGERKLPDELVKYCGKRVKSLSSKICKYLSELIYRKDNYYIYDKYIRHALPFYLDYYGISHNFNKSKDININKLSYEDLYKRLEELRDKINRSYRNTITKNELDHIIWYCYKSLKKVND